MTGRQIACLIVCLPLLACSPPLAPELGDPPGGEVAEMLAVAPPALGYVPSAERPTLRAGETPAASQRLVCVACEEELERQSGPAPTCPECGGTEWRPRLVGPYLPRLDGPAVAARAAELLAERGGFARAVGLAEPPRELGPDERRRALVQAARAAGARWLLAPRLEAGSTRYAGQSGALFGVKIFNLIWTAFFIFPAVDVPNWFIASEHYALDLQGGWQLIDLQSGAGVAEGALEAGAERAFAAFGLGICPSREWYVIGFLRVPNCLDEEAWAEIAEGLAPDARESLARRLVLAAEGARR